MKNNLKKIVILGGGTSTYISNHFAVSAPAYGQTAKALYNKFIAHPENKMQTGMYLTKMADPSQTTLDTPEDVADLVDNLITDPDTRVIIFNVAMVDYKPVELDEWRSEDGSLSETRTKFGKYEERLSTRGTPLISIQMKPYEKIIQKIRKERKDILLVGFKTTCGATKEEQFRKGLSLCKEASANIVFVNDVDKDRISKLKEALALPRNSLRLYELLHGEPYRGDTGHDYMTNPESYRKRQDKRIIERNNKAINELQNNGLVTPEESSYWYNTRDDALNALVQMVLDRSHLHFTRSTVVDSETVPWNIQLREYISLQNEGIPSEPLPVGKFIESPNPLIPSTFRTVFDWVRSQGAYKQGPTGVTVGHFGIKLGPNEFLTSKRKTDFNKIEEVGLVRVITDDPDDVFGYKHFFMTPEEKEYEHWKDCLTLPNFDMTVMPPMLTKFSKDKVIAFGAKPSVGGQSQRSLFEAFPDLNCIVHFHCPLRELSRQFFNTTPQFSYECGSKECIESNLKGFREYKVSTTHSIWAGHMDFHGPNIVFNSDIDPQLVIDFIDTHWDLSRKTDGILPENR